MGLNTTFRIKQGDLLPQLRGRFFQDKLGTLPQSLEGAALELHVKNSAGAVVITQPALPVLPQTTPENTGWWYYDWQPGDTDVAGTFEGEVQATFGSRPLTGPNTKNFKIIMFPEIA